MDNDILIEICESEKSSEIDLKSAIYSGETQEEVKQNHFTEYCEARYGMLLRRDLFFL